MDLNPVDADLSGPTFVDKSAPKGLVFHFADGAKPLATPWQVSIERAKLVRRLELPSGRIIDPACGSGIQLAAYCAILGREGFGIELEEKTAMSAVANFHRIAEHGFGESVMNSVIRIGDGTCADNVTEKFAMLHIDPARPRNSRSHDISEMKPPLDQIFETWKDNLEHGNRGPAILLDLSPRLSHNQRLQVEKIVENYWSNIDLTWTWTSRGGGRIDRLSLWAGQLADPLVRQRYVRIPPDIKQESLIIEGTDIAPIIQSNRLPRKGEFVTILDSALVESGLANDWLNCVLPSQEISWMVTGGRRPQIAHESKIEYQNLDEKNLIQASGKIVKLLHFELNDETISHLIEDAREYGFGKLTLRIPLDPSLHPRIQGSIDRQLSARGGPYVGFVAKHPGDSMLLLCVVTT